jgi:hypothetical protein
VLEILWDLDLGVGIDASAFTRGGVRRTLYPPAAREARASASRRVFI